MKTIATTLIAAFTIALFSTQAQAVELLVRVAGDTFDAQKIAERTAFEAQQRIRRTSYAPSEAWVWNNSISQLGNAQQLFSVAAQYSALAEQSTLKIGQLHPLDPRYGDEVERFQYFCRASHSLTITGWNYVNLAYTQAGRFQTSITPARYAAKQAAGLSYQLVLESEELEIEPLTLRPKDPLGH